MIVAINQQNATVNSTCIHRRLKLNGHYLITFNNCSIQVKGVLFRSNIVEYEQKLILQDEDKQLEVEKVLSFEEIVLTQKENIKKLKELHHHKIITTTSSAFSVTAVVSIIAVGVYLYLKQRSEMEAELPRRNSVSIRSLIRKYPVTEQEAEGSNEQKKVKATKHLTKQKPPYKNFYRKRRH